MLTGILVTLFVIAVLCWLVTSGRLIYLLYESRKTYIPNSKVYFWDLCMLVCVLIIDLIALAVKILT